jgi:nucleotide-binding universal stress UspA family protein
MNQGENGMQSKPIFEKILAATDGSVPSTNAMELTAFVAKKFNSEVTVIHVISHELMHPQFQRFSPDSSVLSSSQEYVGTSYGDLRVPQWEHLHAPVTSNQARSYDEINIWYQEHGKEVIDDAVTPFKEQSIPVDQKLVEDADPAESIVKEAEKGNYSLIAMGHNGEKGEELRLGSVAKRVAHHAKIPVMIARQKTQISRVLVPVDGSANAARALGYAVSVAEKTGAGMTLLCVQEPSLFALKPQIAKEIGTRVLAGAADQIKGIKVDQKLESGHPAKVIIETARNGDYDLIVMGSHGHSSARRFLLGSVSDHVIHYADRSVLLVK